MKKKLQLLGTFAIISILAASCGTAEISKDESKNPNTTENIDESISKDVKAEINDAGEATVTITTNKNGEETIEVLSGTEALTYIAEEKIDMNGNSESSSSSKIVIKSMDTDGDNIDIEEIMNSEEIKEMDEEIKAKVKKGLEEANAEIEVSTEKNSKVIVIQK